MHKGETGCDNLTGRDHAKH